MILETIPPLMDSLQIIWMLSCHYNTDERLAPLMERIAWQLCERVGQVVDVQKLFKYETDLHFFILQIIDEKILKLQKACSKPATFALRN